MNRTVKGGKGGFGGWEGGQELNLPHGEWGTCPFFLCDLGVGGGRSWALRWNGGEA